MISANERSKLASDLRKAFEWMRDSEQPEGAYVCIHGINLPELPKKLKEARVIPGGHTSPAIIFVFETAYCDCREQNFCEHDIYTKENIDALRALVNEVASPGKVVDEWNGEGCGTVSLQVDVLPSPSIRAALSYYDKGCRSSEHGHAPGTVFCNPWHIEAAAKSVKVVW